MTASSIDPASTTKPDYRTLAIGLTGGIGSGKTTVANGFAALGTPVIDADVLARDLVAPGQPALTEITTVFGQEVLTTEGGLNRARVRQLIYADDVRKTQLEAILHPKIRTQIRAFLTNSTAPYSLIVIPLLLEAKQTDLVDRILVVDTTEKEQLSRVAARDKLSDNDILAIIQTQVDRTTRLAAADDIIVNDDGISSLDGRIQQLHEYYMELSQ